MDELVSIIMPSYNTGKYIEETINSILKQTYQNWELLIVDDCSTDNTIEVLSQFQDQRIHLYKNQKNLGAAVSRNLALKAARGKWIAFLDSDDLWMPDKLSKQIAFMQAGDFHFSYTEYCEIDEESLENGKRITGPKRITRSGAERYCWQGCLTVMYDREYVGLIQIEDLKKNNDYAMWIKISKKCDCYLLKEVLGKYRKRRGSISNTGYAKLIRYHYILWREGEKCNRVISVWRTIQNLIFGMLKKMCYVH